MAVGSVLLELTGIIQEKSAEVDKFIRERGLPQPSFDHSYPPILKLSPEADAARQAALEAIDELRCHLLGPLGMIMSHTSEMSHLVSIHGLPHFKIPAALPPDGSAISISDLATETGMHIDDTRTLVRHGSARYLIKSLPGDQVSHSAASKAMLSMPVLTGLIECGLLMTKSTHHIADVMERFPGTQDMSRTAYSLAYNTPLSFFEHLATQPERAQHFAAAMGLLASSPALSADFVFEYDWTPHAHGTMVDVGGSRGHIAFTLAERFPHMHFVVQDRPEIVGSAPDEDRHRSERVKFQEHDFFTPQPVVGASVYFLRFILHDWPTEYCLRILRALIPALRKGSRVVIMDGIVPEPGVLGKLDERRITGYDVLMKALFNAKERSEDEWRTLFDEADTERRFEIVQVLQPKGSQLGFIVAAWQGD
ncbi:hypothetical protein N0V91_007180 [Didymella pomorum]|uniref:O-methyltransferase C-terminal domain-containing protein n=1 Tax=Didymella pomorum TaxID=749634 RepID=A0A9W8ZDC0_9PLEO|nr:hypothetical protein N0V91_007180 [Didymella pomorum]